MLPPYTPPPSCFRMGVPDVSIVVKGPEHLAHRNRSDFCDLRLRCPSRTPEIARFPKQETAMMHCDLRVRWKVASDLRFRAAISEPQTPSFCGISGDLGQSTRKSLAIATVRFWCAKPEHQQRVVLIRMLFACKSFFSWLLWFPWFSCFPWNAGVFSEPEKLPVPVLKGRNYPEI